MMRGGESRILRQRPVSLRGSANESYRRMEQGMKKSEKKASQRVMGSTEKPGDRDDEAMSPQMRTLLLSFVDADSNRTRDAGADTRRSSLTAA